jgi:prepilin-type N-terminal cleavage/methylation domain-containing protein
MKILRSKKGFTLIEIIVVLGVIAVLTAILAPIVVNYIGQAKDRRGDADVQTIGTAVLAFNSDTKEWPIWAVGTAVRPTNTAYEVLNGEAGSVPALAAGVSAAWTTALGSSDSIDDQLITNDPAYPTTTTGTKAWLGPYLERVSEDPWGNRYYIVVKFLKPGISGATNAAYVISAGPDGEIDTAFEMAPGAFIIGDDDVVFRIK